MWLRFVDAEEETMKHAGKPERLKARRLSWIVCYANRSGFDMSGPRVHIAILE